MEYLQCLKACHIYYFPVIRNMFFMKGYIVPNYYSKGRRFGYCDKRRFGY
ncbi:hypothetical protein HMPREF1548_01073 [Clostridium sp. KLE 1755]|nr:hypothetical protein HMPREF1548_01073 [Clostridium sp. KLE 1755]